MVLDLKIEKWWLIFLIVIAIFFLTQINGLNDFDPGDEHVYIYMGKLIAEGNVIYKDFFNSHPPLHILVTAVLYKIFGFREFIFKLIPLLATIISSFFLFKLVKDKFGNMEAIISISLYLTSLELIKFSTYSVGINLTTMFLMAGIYYLYKNKNMISGILFGFAGLSGLYSLPAILVISGILILNNKRRFLHFLYGFLMIFGSVNLTLLIIAGSSYFIPVYQYHLMKPAIEGYSKNIFLNVIKGNLLLFILPSLYLILKNKKHLSLMAILSVIYLLFFSLLGRIFKFYFLIIFPILAILAGVSSYKLSTVIKKEEIRKLAIGIFLLILLFIGIKNVLFVNNTYFSDFDIKDSMPMYIMENSNPNEKIFGDISIVPMMALLSNREIALNMVDTNKMVFESGVVNLSKVLSDLDKENLKFIIIRPFTEVETIDDFKKYTESKCSVAKQFKDRYHGDFFILDCSSNKKENAE